MPYLALQDGEDVIPPQVDGNTELRCPVCGREMYVKRSHYRGDSFVSRHFTHTPDNASSGSGTDSGGGSSECPGESPVHYKMKSIAYSRLGDDYPDASVELERGLNGRIPDVLLTFPEPRAPYGKGIAVEAQYRNKGKDINAVTEHYFENSYSVAWLEEDDFTNHDVDLSGVLPIWPNALPDRDGTEGYAPPVRWLYQDKDPSVEFEIPIPGEYWKSFDKTGEWLTVAEHRTSGRGNIRIVRSPTGDILLDLGKGTRKGGENVLIQAFSSDADILRSFADELDRVAFGDERPPPEECDSDWHELAHNWMTGAETVTAWISASLPSPRSDDIILTFGKKRQGESETVAMKIRPYAVDSFRSIAELLEAVFEIERGDRSFH